MQRESLEQIALFEWANLMSMQYPELELMHHIPNGGKRDYMTARKLKMEGVKAGVPDICLPVARAGYHGLYIELKCGKNKATANQNNWIEALQKQGYYAIVCYGWEDAKDTVEKYLKERVNL